ncbi:hypothetical protein ACFB49_02410 [Sphingomonas sp. DBB INV C78]|uniref:DUF481 domain-containing protein n=1 Tax=Sphingomonas sp. DBB INV C78 TaxID=3349434 RepID=UPI0036D377E4
MPLLSLALLASQAVEVPPDDTSLAVIEAELAPIIYIAPPPPRPLPMPRIEPPPPTELPPAVRAMLDAAIASGDQQAVATVTKLARQAAPWASRQAQALKDGYDADIAEKRALAQRKKEEAIAAAGFFDYWSGTLEFGAYRSTGNSDNAGIFAAAKGEREGLRVRHRFDLRLDLQEDDNELSKERIVANYQPNFKVDDRFYIYGIAGYEHDRFLGYDNRFTGGGGIGYTLFTGPRFKVDLEGGPAVRYTDFTDQEDATSVAGRLSQTLRWKIAPTANLIQDATFYLEKGATNASTSIALDTKVLGPISARITYNVQYEGNAPVNRADVDTQTRATLVYTFK